MSIIQGSVRMCQDFADLSLLGKTGCGAVCTGHKPRKKKTMISCQVRIWRSHAACDYKVTVEHMETIVDNIAGNDNCAIPAL
jgi:hypothetical protein